MSEKNYALLDSSSPKKVINTVVWDATANPGLFTNYVDLTGVSPQPSAPGQMWTGSPQVLTPFHWTYDGSNFTQVIGS